MTLALQATGITKRFPGVLANDHVNSFLERGENGAGKSQKESLRKMFLSEFPAQELLEDVLDIEQLLTI